MMMTPALVVLVRVKDSKTIKDSRFLSRLLLLLLLFTGVYSLHYNHSMSMKNRDADLTNPNVNIYHSIDDDNKVDHVYDEIKLKEGYKDVGEYFVEKFEPSTMNFIYIFTIFRRV